MNGTKENTENHKKAGMNIICTSILKYHIQGRSTYEYQQGDLQHSLLRKDKEMILSTRLITYCHNTFKISCHYIYTCITNKFLVTLYGPASQDIPDSQSESDPELLSSLLS